MSAARELFGAVGAFGLQLGANIDVLSAGAFLSMVVPPIVFFAFRRYFVRAPLAGSTK
jgi:alpha-glucoside transport system permease protein